MGASSNFPRTTRLPSLNRFKTSLLSLPPSSGLSSLSNRVANNYPTRIHLERLKASRTFSMATSQTLPKPGRPTCPECSKPQQFCLCSRLRTGKVDNSVSVTILQHSLEKKHHLNSTRIARLGLKNVNVVTVCDVSYEARFVISSVSPFVHNGSEVSAIDRVSDERETLRLGSDRSAISGSCLEDFSSETSPEFLSDGSVDWDVNVVDEATSNGKTKPIFRDEVSWSGFKAINGQAGEKICFTATIGKYGESNDGKKQGVYEDAPSWLAMPALTQGITVRKFQARKLEGVDEFGESEEFELTVPAGSVLLFPTENAVRVNELKMMHYEVRNLIVLDGTWGKAKRMYVENPWLKFLPHLRLETGGISLYSEVRQQPKAGYLSTIESIVHSLKALGEDQEGLEGLLDVFGSMVADQRRCKDERLKKVSTD